MSSCEKCWRDSCGDPDRYQELVDKRNANHNICTLEEQAGEGGYCESCKRNTVHMYTGKCINRDCKLFGEKQLADSEQSALIEPEMIAGNPETRNADNSEEG